MMPTLKDITVCFLTWKSPKTFQRTVESLLMSYFGDRLCFAQELSPSHYTKSICNQYGISLIGAPRNVGIGPAMKSLIECAVRTPYMLFVEEDWEAVTEPPWQQAFLQDALHALDWSHVCRLRSRYSFGKPLYGIGERSTTHKLNSLHWTSDDDILLDNDFDSDENCFITDAGKANWTNNPFLAHREFLERDIMPFCEGDGIALERDIQPWWEQQGDRIKVAQHKVGIFRHGRID